MHALANDGKQQKYDAAYAVTEIMETKVTESKQCQMQHD